MAIWFKPLTVRNFGVKARLRRSRQNRGALERRAFSFAFFSFACFSCGSAHVGPVPIHSFCGDQPPHALFVGASPHAPGIFPDKRSAIHQQLTLTRHAVSTVQAGTPMTVTEEALCPHETSQGTEGYAKASDRMRARASFVSKYPRVNGLEGQRGSAPFTDRSGTARKTQGLHKAQRALTPIPRLASASRQFLSNLHPL